MSGPCLCQGDDCYGEISSLEETFLRLANSPPRSPALLVEGGVLPGIDSSVVQSNPAHKELSFRFVYAVRNFTKSA